MKELTKLFFVSSILLILSVGCSDTPDKPKEKQKYLQVPSPALDSDSDADLIDGAFDDTEDEF